MKTMGDTMERRETARGRIKISPIDKSRQNCSPGEVNLWNKNKCVVRQIIGRKGQKAITFRVFWKWANKLIFLSLIFFLISHFHVEESEMENIRFGLLWWRLRNKNFMGPFSLQIFLICLFSHRPDCH